MPIEHVYIARVIDGLILVASMEQNAGSGNDRMEPYKQQAKQLLKRLNPRSTSKMSIESGSYTFHYMIDNGICYLSLTEKAYPKRLAFLFLEEIAREFEADLRAEYGEEWLRTVETVGRQYAFIKFDRIIQKKRRDYLDPSSSANMKKLNDDLQSIHNIMRKTIDDVLDRGSKLDDVSAISQNLANESKKYNWGAKQLSMLAWWKHWAPMISVVVIALIVVIYRFVL
jgi:vesicle transport protein SEC22